MKIWLVNHYALPPQRSGGTRHYTLARHLMRRGHEVFLVASSVDYMQREEAYLSPGETARLEEKGGVPFLWLRTSPYHRNSVGRVRNMLTFAWRVKVETPRYLPSPDVIVGSSPHLFAAWSAYLLARRYGVPFVLEVRDLWPQSLIDLGGFSPFHPFILLLSMLERLLYRRAQAIVSLLPGGKEYIEQRAGRREGVFWIPNGVDFNLLPPPTPPSETLPFTVLYAGAHGLANGLGVALQAARQLQEEGWGERILFRFIGDGPAKPQLLQQAKRWGLQNVVFEPPVPKEKIYDHLLRADAFLMVLRDSPLFRWGISPNKLFDFMAMARPVLFCVRTPYNPVAENRAGVVVPPNDPAALAEAVRVLAQTPPEKRWEMGLRGRAYVEREHDWARLATRFEQVLRHAKNSATI